MEEQYCWSMKRPPGYLNVGIILKNASKMYPERLVINAINGEEKTLKKINENANRLANGLSSKLKNGSFIPVIAKNSRIEWLELYFGVARAGMIIVPLSYRLSRNEVENLLRYINSEILIFDYSYIDKINNIDFAGEKFFIGNEETNFENYIALFSNNISEPNVDIRDDTPVVLGFTSGTTGPPKAYLRSHYANFLNHICYALSFDINYKDIALNAVPALSGLSWEIGVILAGGTNILIDFDPVSVLNAIEKYKVTIMYGVPTMYYSMLHNEYLNKINLKSLRAVASVGAPLSVSLLNQIWEKISQNVYDHIGLTETGFVAVGKPEMKRKKPEAVGPPTCLHEIKIVDEKGIEKKSGDIGELIIRYPDGFGEYWQNPQKNRESFKNGWFYTGDLAKIDEDGYLYVIGRLKDMIISGGYNVYATEVENIILTNPKVADCAVIGIPDEKWGEKVVAVVKIKTNESTTEEEIIEYCKERMASYKVPKKVIFDEIPRNPTGKIMKFILIEKYSKK
ncbi:MAG: class I adenylate-forming enzyme family protein [Thermoplasmata archaeon]|uniref:class I adenylate-forming enzyme family protein n=1 Tax=Caldisericum sp. TaxID=2499687 RepID=UPI003CC2A87F